MALDVSADTLRTAAQDTILIGGFLMAIGYGIRRIYRMARNVETLVNTSKHDAAERKKIADNLAAHVEMERTNREQMDAIVESLSAGQKEILREIRPNGGSSIKDVVNAIQRDVAVLSQWKEDVQDRGVKKTPRS